jgi:hypothetical protein
MKLNKQQLEYFYRLYDLNPMSVIMSRLMEQVEEYITKKDLNEV